MELEEDPAKSLNIIMELEEDPAKSLNIRKCASHLGFSLVHQPVETGGCHSERSEESGAVGLPHPRFFLAALVRMTMRHNHLEMVLVVQLEDGGD